jgi:hypothetical protein
MILTNSTTKLAALTVAQLALAAARMDVVDPKELKHKHPMQQALNNLAWAANWSAREGNYIVVRAEGLLDVFKASRDSVQAHSQDERLVRAVVIDGDLGGQYLYEPEFGRLSARLVVANEPQYSVHFCHPEDEEIHRASDQPYEFLEVPTSLYELSSVTASLKT